MTCIVGIESNSGATLSADSSSVGNHHTRRVNGSKVFSYDNGTICGYTTSFRMGQILEHHVVPPELDRNERDYVIEVLIPEVRRAMKDRGYSEVQNNEEKGGFFLLGIEDKIFKVQRDFSAIRYQEPYFAVGEGAREAYGAISAILNMDNGNIESPKFVAEAAIKAAAKFNSGVKLPITTCQTSA